MRVHRYYLTQRGISIGTQPKDFVSSADTQGEELTNGRRCYGYVDYNRKLTPEEVEEYELTPHSDTAHIREYKPFKGWHEFSEQTGKHNYYDYAKPGDEVDEETYNYFLDILPPVTLKHGYFQVGEPYSHAEDESGKWRATWTTFIHEGDKYYYLGHCFAGGYEHQG